MRCSCNLRCWAQVSHVFGKPRWLCVLRVQLLRCTSVGATECSSEYLKRTDWVGRILLPCDLFNFMGAVMKEHRELQTLIDELERHIIQQDNLIEKLERDAMRYRWLNKYTSQLFMVTEEQMNAEVDRAMARGMK